MATIDIATLATELSTDARTTRKFLRSITPADAQPGKGSRWAIEKRDLRSLRSKFTKFTADAAAAKLDAPAAPTKGISLTKPELTASLDEPTADDLAAIEAETE